jgi:hypothetical protein
MASDDIIFDFQWIFNVTNSRKTAITDKREPNKSFPIWISLFRRVKSAVRITSTLDPTFHVSKKKEKKISI